MDQLKGQQGALPREQQDAGDGIALIRLDFTAGSSSPRGARILYNLFCRRRRLSQRDRTQRWF